MDVSSWAKTVTMIVGVFSIYHYIFQIHGSKKTKIREEYKFLKEFLLDRKNKEIHPYALEKGCVAISGDPHLTIQEFDYLMTLEYPTDVIKQFSFTRKYLEHIETSAVEEIAFKKKWKSKRRRNIYRVFYAISYFVCSLSALSLVFFFKQIFGHPSATIITPVFVLFVILGYWSVRSLIESRRFLDANTLFLGQKKRTQALATEMHGATN